MVSRAHRAHLFCAYRRPTVRIILPLLTVPISQRCLFPLQPLHSQSCRDHAHIHPTHPEDEIRAAGGECLMHRSHLKSTAKRLALAKSAPTSLLTWHPKRRAQHRLCMPLLRLSHSKAAPVNPGLRPSREQWQARTSCSRN